MPYNIQWGEGVGALEASRDLEPGQVVSRAMAVPGPTAEQVTRAAMADPGTPWGHGGSGDSVGPWRIRGLGRPNFLG